MEQKDAIVKLRESLNMNRKEFGLAYGIPYSTLTDWELGKKQMPDYVLRLLEYKVMMDTAAKKKEASENEEQN